MPIIEAIKSRNSNAFMSGEDIDPDLIRKILDAAVCSPVHYMTNPWRFLVISGDGRKRLGAVMADHMARGMTDPDSTDNKKLLDKIRKKPFRAPVIIVAGAAKPIIPKAKMIENVASVTAACQNILLAASALGLSAIWRTGGMTYAEDTAGLLGFEDDTELVGFIYLGYASKDMPPKPRPTSEDFTHWLTD
ncbi:MAG: nitroreductase [Alphaproteobacteria bacterium]|nr:MAG: nitroreductase [Alphaproteobacteria bacterium]